MIRVFFARYEYKINDKIQLKKYFKNKIEFLYYIPNNNFNNK